MLGASDLHSAQTVFLFLLLLVVVVGSLARRVGTPYPILLVIAGLGISFIPRVPRVPLDPELVFLIFLPPLLFASAWKTNWRAFRRNLVSILMLAIGLVAFTVLGVAFVADRFITALDWKSGFILGAVVATTDAIAASSIAKSIGLPQRIVDLLEGESLVNDATGLLALEFGLQMLLRGQTPTVGYGLLRLLWLLGGGLAIGFVIGILTAWFERWIEDGPLEMVISIIVPYIAYLAGEEVKASGVLAVVACGLYLSRKSESIFSPAVRIQLWSLWAALDFMLNGLVFVLIGLQLPYVLAGIEGYSRGTLLAYGAIFTGVLIVFRIAWMYPGAAVSAWVRRHLLHQAVQPVSRREIFVVGWTGMRGVVALAAAISLPETLGDGQPFVQRNLILFLTFSVILATLVIQGLSLPALVRALGLAGSTGSDDEETEARRTILEEVERHLEAGLEGNTDGHEKHGYEDLLHRYRHRLSELREAEEDQVQSAQVIRRLGLEAIEVERKTLIRLRDEGRIDDDVMRSLEQELDLTQTVRERRATAS